MRKESVPLGGDVVAFVAKLAQSGAGWVTAVGYLDGVEIAVVRGSGEDVQSVPGRVTLVSLLGPVLGPLMVTLVRSDTGGSSLVAGRLVKARSAGVEFAVEVAPVGTVAATSAVAAIEAATAAPGWAEVTEPRAPEPIPRPGDEDDEADETPKSGDRVDHFVFGLCEVMVVRGERMKIKDVASGKLREIHVGAFKVKKPVTLDGKRVFKLMKRG